MSAAEVRQARAASRSGQAGAAQAAAAASNGDERWSRQGSGSRPGVPVRSGRTAPRRTVPGRSAHGASGSGSGDSGRPPSGPNPPVAAAAPQPPGKRHWSRRRKVILSTVGVFLVAILSIGGVLAYKANRAYQSIFIQPPPKPIVTKDASGKQIIVEPGSTDKSTKTANTPPDSTTAAGQNVPTPTPIPGWTGTNRVNILLLGVDSDADRAKSGEPPLSDTIIVLSIDPTTKKINMMSLPRDMLVSIPGYGDAKINAAYSDGSLTKYTGPGLVQSTIENDFHIPINYFAVVDFQGFEKIINTFGGVVIDVPAPIKDDQYPGQDFNYTRVYFHTGLQHMDGETALDYVRTRHDDNDFARGLRQQQLLEALRAQATAFNLISKAPTLIDELGNTIKTDMPPSDALRLAKLMSETNSSDIHSVSLLPALTEQWNQGEPYYLIPDWSKVNQIVQQQLIPPVSSAKPASKAPASPSATAQQPDLQARVLVENGTFIDQLAAHAAAKLSGQGFLNVSTQQSPNAGNQPHTEIINYSQNQATPRLIAQTLALPQSDIVQGNPSQANGYGVIVILGNDAPNS